MGKAGLVGWCAAVIAGLSLLGSAGGGEVALPRYRVTVVDEIPGSTYPRPTALNNRGDILIETSLRTDKRIHSYRWSQGRIVDVSALVGQSRGSDRSLIAYARAINDKGDIVGGFLTAEGKEAGHAFHWHDGTLTDLRTLGGKSSEAWDVNNAGQVVGRAENAKGETRAFLWEAGRGMRDLNAPGRDPWAFRISGKGQVIGYTEGNTRSFQWERGKATILNPTPLEGFKAFVALNINERGDIIGGFDRGGAGGTHEDRIALYRDGKTTLIELPQPSKSSNAFGLTSNGLVVGNAFQTPSGQHAFIWKDGKSALLNHLLPPEEKWDIYFATAVNDKGQIAAVGRREGKTHMLLLTPQ